MIENTTLKADVDDIRAKALARQAMDNATSGEVETLDIPNNTRRAIPGRDCTLEDMAAALGMEGKYAKQNMSKVLKKAIENYMKKFYLVSLVQSCIRQGFDSDDAVHLANVSWDLEIASGKTKIEILGEIINVENETDFYMPSLPVE